MVYTVFYKTSSFAGYCFLDKNSIHPKRRDVFNFEHFKVTLVKFQICSFIVNNIRYCLKVHCPIFPEFSVRNVADRIKRLTFIKLPCRSVTHFSNYFFFCNAFHLPSPPVPVTSSLSPLTNALIIFP